MDPNSGELQTILGCAYAIVGRFISSKFTLKIEKTKIRARFLFYFS